MTAMIRVYRSMRDGSRIGIRFGRRESFRAALRYRSARALR